jgi:hypothetical protein
MTMKMLAQHFEVLLASDVVLFNEPLFSNTSEKRPANIPGYLLNYF